MHGRQPLSRSNQPWRKWYSTAQWERLRQATFLRDRYQCQRCKRLEGNTSKLICDHVTPHRGDQSKFFNPDNLTTLCKPCHDSAKQREEQASLQTRGVWY